MTPKVNTIRESFQFGIRKNVYQGWLKKECIAQTDCSAITRGVHVSFGQLLVEVTSEGI